MSSSVQSESPRSSSSESLSSRNDEVEHHRINTIRFILFNLTALQTVSLEAKMAINIVLNRFFLSNDVKGILTLFGRI